MRAIAITALVASIALASPAQAQYYPYRNDWVAPFVGGAIVGGLVAPLLVPPPPVYVPPPAYYAPPPPAYYVPPAPRCWTQITGYDYYGAPIYQRVCD